MTGWLAANESSFSLAIFSVVISMFLLVSSFFSVLLMFIQRRTAPTGRCLCARKNRRRRFSPTHRNGSYHENDSIVVPTRNFECHRFQFVPAVLILFPNCSGGAPTSRRHRRPTRRRLSPRPVRFDVTPQCKLTSNQPRRRHVTATCYSFLSSPRTCQH